LAPAVDLSVVALLFALHHLVVYGVAPGRLRSARVLLAFSGVATLTLNAAEPIVVGAYGRAAFDAVEPLLLIGWSEVGLALLSQIYAVRPPTPRSVKDDTHPQPGTPLVEEIGAALAAARNGPGRPALASMPDVELLAAARDLDVAHRREHGRPVSADTLRGALGVGSAKARELVAAVRAGSTS
jgi:hypothetical protein